MTSATNTKSAVSALWLEQEILKMLEEAGVGRLTAENQEKYLPQFVTEAQFRLGVALTPHLTTETAEELANLIDSDAGAEEMEVFWHKAVPEYDSVIKNALEEYTQECVALLQAH